MNEPFIEKIYSILIETRLKKTQYSYKLHANEHFDPYHHNFYFSAFLGFQNLKQKLNK